MIHKLKALIRFNFDEIHTPVGDALIVTDCTGLLRAFDWKDRCEDMMTLLGRHYGLVKLERRRANLQITQAIQNYFEGDLTALQTVTWQTGGSLFQKKVWEALASIEPGKTLAYGALAEKLGMPGAARAVGLANGANPISLFIPCHRVIGASGALTGYGGGVARKRWLLRHEGADVKAI